MGLIADLLTLLLLHLYCDVFPAKNIISVAIASAVAYIPPEVQEKLAQLSENNVPKAGKACDTTVTLNHFFKYDLR